MGAITEDGSPCTPVAIPERKKPDKLSLNFIDTEQFQRLRDVKQLGLCNLVYPGATHSRLEHSLGVYKRARESVEILQKNWPELEIDESDIRTVSLAGLLHDVGHGPFSHVFDNEFLPRVMPGLQWSHEDMSTQMIDYIVCEYDVDITKSDVDRIKDMIMCSKDPSLSSKRGEKGFLFDIVANGRNSIDVDKFDYIVRDCRACGLDCNFKPDRLLNDMKVIDDEICYRASLDRDVYQLFHTRADLFRTVYTHRKVKAMELMLADVLTLANTHLGITTHITDAKDFWKLDDCLLKTIETSDDEELRDAKALAIRMKRRGKNLYQFCNEYIVPKDQLSNFKDVTSQDIVCSQKGGTSIPEDDVVVSNVKIDLACGKEDPMDKVHFFTEYDSWEKYKIKPSQVSNFCSDCSLDRIVRVYTKKPELVEAVSDAFEEFQLITYGIKAQVHGTPDGKKRRKN